MGRFSDSFFMFFAGIKGSIEADLEERCHISLSEITFIYDCGKG